MRFVNEDSPHVVQDGLELDVRLPWYRSLPLSVIDFGDIRVDGNTIGYDAITVKLNGKERKLSELAGLWQENWFVLDSAFLRIPISNAKRRDQYEIEITVVLHPPYVPNVFFPSVHKKLMRAN
jgi:hypothetical protein